MFNLWAVTLEAAKNMETARAENRIFKQDPGRTEAGLFWRVGDGNDCECGEVRKETRFREIGALYASFSCVGRGFRELI